jgi:uncharacterized membrane protein YfcA
MEHLALCLAVFLGGVVTGFAGFAFSAVAGAILLHILDPMLAVPAMMLLSIVSQVSASAVLRQGIAWRQSVPMLIGGAAGVPIALYVLTLVDPHTYRVGFGVFLVGYSGYMLVWRPSALLGKLGGVATRASVGFAGGLVGGLTAMPGALPAIWCGLQGLPKEEQRSLVQPFILGMQGLAIALLLCRPGALHGDLIGIVVVAMPAMLAGTMLGVALFGRIDDRKFRLVILLVLLLSGALMIR